MIDLSGIDRKHQWKAERLSAYLSDGEVDFN